MIITSARLWWMSLALPSNVAASALRVVAFWPSITGRSPPGPRTPQMRTGLAAVPFAATRNLPRYGSVRW